MARSMIVEGPLTPEEGGTILNVYIPPELRDQRMQHIQQILGTDSFAGKLDGSISTLTIRIFAANSEQIRDMAEAIRTRAKEHNLEAIVVLKDKFN